MSDHRVLAIIGMTILIAGCDAPSAPPDQTSQQANADRLARYERCMADFDAKRAAYVARYKKEPLILRRNATNTENAEIGCPEIVDQPPLPSAEELVKSSGIKRSTTYYSGHEAGRLWAEENQIDDPASCSNASSSFEEGCIEAVETRRQQ